MFVPLVSIYPITLIGFTIDVKRSLGPERVSLEMRAEWRIVIFALILLFAHGDVSGQSSVGPDRGRVRGQVWTPRRIREADLTTKLRSILAPESMVRFNLDLYLADQERETTRRISEGEFEHLIYYILQARRFTNHVPVEPALSAFDYVQTMDPVERSRFLDGQDVGVSPPRSAQVRIDDFLSVVKRNEQPPDERLEYFRRLVGSAGGDTLRPVRMLHREYARTMRFLYRKEFATRQVGIEKQAGFVAQLYRQRAHSTDTQIESGFGVDLALATLGEMEPRPVLARILVVGPGHDLAPRTGFLDALPPQSFQPFSLIDSVFRHRLARSGQLNLHCIDINPRVVSHLSRLAGRTVQLDLVSGISARAGVSFTTEFRDYFASLGTVIGRRMPFYPAVGTVPLPDGHLTGRIEVGPLVTGLISADRLNIIGERYDPSPQFDLVVVTNVFPYFETRLELPLAMANLAAMIRPGGYLIHNELSIATAPIFTVVGLPMIQARTMTIATTAREPLFDGVAVHRRE